VEDYIKQETRLKGGYFYQYDDEEDKTWQLTFKQMLKKVRKLKDNRYIASAEFESNDAMPTDLVVDFIMKRKASRFTPESIKIRMVGRTPRYSYKVRGSKKTGASSLDLAPDFSLPDLSGKMVNLSNYRGKIVILNFWATWCPPCKAEIPDFIELYNEYKSNGLAIIGISLDPDRIKAVERFMEEYKINYPVVIGNMKVTALYGGISAIPTTFVLTRNGGIYKKYVGYRNRSVFEKDIKALLQ
ncbi:MAG: redoxin domain-containing protein, partial [Elusimicrobia bacterium]|nr:redoxin domain-containing protein [Elusimicrobiota bacterium]